MVAPHDHLLQRRHFTAGLGGELRQRAVVVQAQHAVVVVRVGAADLDGGGAGDVGVGVAGVAHDQHADVFLGVLGDGLALNGEDGAVGGQQVGTLHAGAARTGADQQAHVGVLERDVGVVGGDHAGEQREGAVFQLHHHALDGLLGLGQVEQLQDDGLVLAQHFATGDAEQQAVADLAGGAGDSNAHGGFAHMITPSIETLLDELEPGPMRARQVNPDSGVPEPRQARGY